MDIPQPPQDTELRNIIDKLAQFVARNGPEFEQMTKSKQKGNPKFQFLYGGEYYNYYQYKVQTEQQILRQGAMNNQSNPPNPAWNLPNPQQNNGSVEQISQQQETLKEQIMQSEQNLTAQHTVLLQQQQQNVEATVCKLENETLKVKADECGIDLENLNQVLQPIIDSCTKDSISNGKGWILNHAASEAQADCIGHCLLLKVIHGAVPFSQKLHIIYLVNDVLHHCARKHADELKKSLENVVVPMFCNASVGATEEQRNKLDKLLKLWESKANYLAPTTVEKLRQPTVSYQQYQALQVAKYSDEVNPIAQQTKATFDGYQAQHQAFVSHAMQQILTLQQQKQALEASSSTCTTVVQPNQNIPQPPVIPPPIINQPLPIDVQSSLSTVTSPGVNSQTTSSYPPATNPPPPSLMATAPPEFNLPINPSVPPPNLAPPNGMDTPLFNQPPPGLESAFLPGGFPDFSKPPPGFPIPPVTKPVEVVEELLPSVPYYDLPAGLMIPLIKLDDASYKPIDPKAIRLPPPAPPSERLLAAVEAFYAIPSHDRPRDSEGWEKLGLYEYYKAKNNARKLKEEQIAAGLREKSKSPSPIVMPHAKSPSPPKRRYQSRSPSLDRTQSSSSSHRRSRSRSPVESRGRKRGSRGKNKRRRSDSRSKSRSRSPPSRNDREDRMQNRNRSPTPPSFVTPFMRPEVQEIDESNKGHQMLRKMGWGGTGLGAHEQGIDAPISGGDVRDRQDLYKGVGMSLNDPYENFRKHKGAAFITRMKARAEERAQENKVFQEN